MYIEWIDKSHVVDICVLQAVIVICSMLSRPSSDFVATWRTCSALKPVSAPKRAMLAFVKVRGTDRAGWRRAATRALEQRDAAPRDPSGLWCGTRRVTSTAPALSPTPMDPGGFEAGRRQLGDERHCTGIGWDQLSSALRWSRV